jgi:DNA-binding MarR family transcriptional regulator
MNKRVKNIKTISDEFNPTSIKWVIDVHKIITRVSTNHQIYLNRLHAENNISANGASILHELLENDGSMNQKKLTNTMPITKQVLHANLKTLLKQGLIERETIAQDRRKRRIHLTQKGIEVLNSSLPLMKNFFSTYMDCINENEGKNIITIFTKLNKYYEKETKKLAKNKRNRRKGEEQQTTT